MNQRKLWSGIIAITVAGAILFSFTFLNKPKTAATQPLSAAPPITPPNPAHEKASLEEQLKTNPQHAPILLRLAELERDAGKKEAAMDYLKRAASENPNNEDALLELSKALYETGDMAGALKQNQLLLSAHPDSVDGLYNLGAIYANNNQLDLARQYWTRAVAAKADSESGRKAQDGLKQIAH